MAVNTRVLSILLLTSGWMPLTVCAQEAPPVLTPESAQAFFQRVVPDVMRDAHAPGAVVVVVKDGQTIFKRGFGVANIETGTPVDADETVFRVASVSKPVTVFTTLRLVDQGKVALDADVNRYLKGFQIPEAYGQPVRVWNLFTHTGGFDDREMSFSARTAEELKPLGEYLRERMPPRVAPPGKYYSYSSHGISLAAYIDECVLGEPYEEIAEQLTFRPLGMTNSSFTYPERLQSKRAAGYTWEHGRYVRALDDYPQIAPAASLLTTGGDMARFMTVLLDHGRIGDKQLLSEELARKMLTRQFTTDERIPGASYGFYESGHGKRTVFIQNGEWFGFSSLLVFLPEENLAYFMAVNSEEVSVSYRVLEQLSKTYFPAEELSRMASPTNVDLKEYEGKYVMEHYPQRSIEKLARLVRESSVKSGGKPGELEIDATDYGHVEVGTAGQDFFTGGRESPRVAFGRDEAGRVNYLFIDHQAFRKLMWYQTRNVQIALFALFGMIFGLAALAWPAQRVWARPEFADDRVSPWVSSLGALNFLFLAGVTLSLYFREPLGYYYHLPMTILILLPVPLITGWLALWVFYLLRTEESRDAAGSRRWAYAAIAAAALLFIPFLSYWHLWGFQS